MFGFDPYTLIPAIAALVCVLIARHVERERERSDDDGEE